jgi:16S rRNA processing protein RimM
MIEVHIKSVKTQNGRLIVSFKEFNDINQVEKYKNCGIYADRDTLEPLDEDEVYINDLIGMDVYNEDKKFIGKVIDTREYPQCYYLVVKGETKNHLIPFIEEFVTEVTDVIVIHEMEGLL